MKPNPIDTLINAVLILLLAVLCIVGGFFGRGIYDRLHVVRAPDAAAPVVIQPDGSWMVERRPDASAKPKMQIPKGAKVERIVQVTVQASAPDHIEDHLTMVGDHIPGTTKMICPPVTLDLALVRMQDQSRRVIAKALDGTILAAIDTPVSDNYAAPKLWAAGVSHDSQRKSGIWVDRDVGPVRAGLAVRQGELGLIGELRAGVRF